MQTAQRHSDPRRSGFSGLGAVSLFLAAVIVLTGTPAILAWSLADSTHPIARMGSQLKRLAVAERVAVKAPRRQHHRPALVAAGEARESRSPVGVAMTLRGFEGPTVAPLLAQYMDLPPPARAM